MQKIKPKEFKLLKERREFRGLTDKQIESEIISTQIGVMRMLHKDNPDGTLGLSECDKCRRGTHKEASYMSLIPTRKQVADDPNVFPMNDSWLFMGQPKVGKTTLAAAFPNPLIIDLEDGTNEIDGYVFKPDTFQQLEEIYCELEDKCDFETIVIDSMDIVQEWTQGAAIKYLNKKFKKNYEDVGEIPNGAGWADSRTRMMSFVEAWKRVPANIVYVAHTKAVMAEKGGIMEKSKTLDLSGKLAHRIPAKIDNIGYCFAERVKVDDGFEIRRFISFQPYEELEAGCRRKALTGKIIPMTFQDIRAQFTGRGATGPVREAHPKRTARRNGQNQRKPKPRPRPRRK